jgi:hypothetical protein
VAFSIGGTLNKLDCLMIKHSGRTWWEAMYLDGHTVAEWDTLTEKGVGRTSRGEEVNKKNMLRLRLLCPNGMAGELVAGEGCRFFQLKAGSIAVGSGESQHTCSAHIIGVVLNAEGRCLCRAWEPAEQKLIQFEDNIYHMKYRNIGCLSLEAQGLKV